MFYNFPSNSLFSTKSLRLFTCTLMHKKRIILSLSSGWLFQNGAVVKRIRDTLLSPSTVMIGIPKFFTCCLMLGPMATANCWRIVNVCCTCMGRASTLCSNHSTVCSEFQKSAAIWSMQ